MEELSKLKNDSKPTFNRVQLDWLLIYFIEFVNKSNRFEKDEIQNVICVNIGRLFCYDFCFYTN
jgi:hypothetical protein